MTSRPKIKVGTKLPVTFAVTDVRTPRKVHLIVASGDVVLRKPAQGTGQAWTMYGVSPGEAIVMEMSGTVSLPVGSHEIGIAVDIATGERDVHRDQARPRRWTARIEIVEPDFPSRE